MAGVPEWKAKRRSRHISAETFAGYVRAAEEYGDLHRLQGTRGHVMG
jgi:hypothetical protein